MSQDVQWLRDYAINGCEQSFAAIVERYHRIVYSSALRQVGDQATAEEVTQAVFVILARKARSLSTDVILSGWLFRTTRFVAGRARRERSRRQKYEKEAVPMNPEDDAAAARVDWAEIAPVLDDALARLGETDRHAILLRFFERKELKEVGSVLGSTEEAARKRVSRALDKLHSFLTRRGIVLTTAVLASALTANAVQAAPVTLLPAITAIVAANGGSTAATLTLIHASMKAMFYAKLQPIAISAALLLVVVGIGSVVAQQATRTTAGQRVLFQDDFESGNLAQWTGNLYGPHHGAVVADPLRPGNRVLAFTALVSGGDLFTTASFPVANSNSQYVVSFDYLGLPRDGSVPGNLGGFIGVAASIDQWDQGRSFIAGTDLSGVSPPMNVELNDDGLWHHYEIDISPLIQQSSFTAVHLMLEDWADIGGVPGDAYFDNIRFSEVARRESRLQVHVTEVTACWESEANQSYQLQYRSTMTPGGWINVGGTVTGDGGTRCVADHVPLNEPQRFYRVLKVP